ncbi:hypothetical protein M8J75_007928 [Diaphorina citri]|nr:hypothetical protein M8J75_007928 [Diaphorina citri]KAI5735371.1 hypothetical protein M8J77_017499 [Diaphorina citri]
MEGIHRIKSFPVKDIGTMEWFSNQQEIVKLHQNIISEMKDGDQSVTARIIQEEGTTAVILQEMIALSVWKTQVLTEIKKKDVLDQVFPVYSILFFESVCASVLLSVMYCNEADLINMFEEEVLCELVDHCVQHIVLLIGMTNNKSPINLQASTLDESLSNSQRIAQFQRDLQYQVCNILLSILRLVVDHIEDLSLSLVTRLVQYHDVAMLLVHLVENQAWIARDTEGNEIKYNDTWTVARSEDRFILGKYEAQTWKMLLDLLMHPKAAELYEISVYRKNELLKLEKHLHEIIIDQFPALHCFRQWFAQLKMTNGRNVAPKPLVLEMETDSIRTKLEREDWSAITEQTVSMLNNVEYLKEIAAKHSNIYVDFEKLYETGRKASSGEGNPRLCSTCDSKAVFKCSRCRQVWYCNKTCQTKHWGVHKKFCQA